MPTRPSKTKVFTILLWHHLLFYKRNKCKLFGTLITPIVLLGLISGFAYYMQHKMMEGHAEKASYIPMFELETIVKSLDQSPQEWLQLAKSAVPAISESPRMCRSLDMLAAQHGKHWQCMLPFLLSRNFSSRRFNTVFGKIIYFPDTSEVKKVMKIVEKALHIKMKAADDALTETRSDLNSSTVEACFRSATVGFQSKDSAIRFVDETELKLSWLGQHCGWKYGHGDWSLPYTMAVVDFTGYSATDPTYTVVSVAKAKDAAPGEVHAMALIDDAIRNNQAIKKIISGVYHTDGRLCTSIRSQFAFFVLVIVLATMFFVLPWYTLDITKQIAADKQEDRRKALRAVGVYGFIISCSWIVFASFFAVLFSTLAALTLQIAVPYGNSMEILIGYLLYNTAQAMFMVLLVTIAGRKTTKLTSLYTLILLIGGVVSYGLLQNPSHFHGSRLTGTYALCLFFPAPLLLTAVYMQEWTKLGMKSCWQVLNRSPFIWDDFGGISACFMMLLVDAIVYFVVAMLLEHIREGSLLRLFKCRSSGKSNHDSSTQLNNIDGEREAAEGAIRLVNIFKKYGDVDVLSDIEVEFPGKKITAFLGQNGAGKSTTASIMVGFIDQTSGSVLYGNDDFHSNREIISERLSYLPQEDALYDHLTLTEHIKFYGWLKGLSSSQIKESLLQLDRYDLRVVKDVLGTRLSGGQKRKLGIFIAYLGDPAYVVLDEPTSGVDVFSARTIWDVILNRKGNATTVVSTHRIEDAEVLADNVIVIDRGRILAQGTPFHLKEEMNLGFSLILDETGLSSSQCEELKTLISTELQLPAEKVPEDLTFTIDHSIGESDEFIECLKKLEDRMDAFGSGNYGVSDATLGDVYNEALRRHPSNVTFPSMEIVSEAYSQKRTKTPLRQLLALLHRRYHHYMDSKLMMVYLMLTPIIITLFAGYLTKASGIAGSLTGTLRPSELHRKQTWVIVLDDSLHFDDELEKYLQSILGESFSVEDAVRENNASCCCKPSSGCADILSRLTPKKGRSPFDHIFTFRTKDFNVSDLLPARNSRHPSCGEKYSGLQGYMQAVLVAIRKPMAPFAGALFVHGKPQGTMITVALAKNFKPFGWAAILDRIGSLNSTKTVRRTFEYGRLRGQTSWGDREGQLRSILLALTFSTFAFPPLLSLLKYFVTNDRKSGRKHLLDLSGTSQVIYWLANLIADLVPYFTVIAVMLIITEVILPIGTSSSFPLYPLGAAMAVPYIYLLVVLLGGRGFLLSTGFEELLLIAGLVLPAIGTMGAISGDSGPFGMVASVMLQLSRVFRVIPSFFIGNTFVLQILPKVGFAKVPRAQVIINAQRNECIATGIVFIFIYTALLLGVEYAGIKVICRRHKNKFKPSSENLDPDVAAEVTKTHETLASAPSSLPLAAANLTKIYGKNKKPAVNDVTFGVQKDECFGLLGVNGAGKTTTFRMLTGLFRPDVGECYINGTPFSRRPIKVYDHMMYCPQEDTLFEYLTTSQHVILFTRLAGYSEGFCRQMHDTFMSAMDIQKYSDRKVGQLSGGNKRKVQLVSSVISCPAVAFLDEPTTGLDPTARQLAWNVIGAIKKNASVVLTSHSLDDCEALCDRLVIMVAGQFRCIGSIQYLKHKLGNKYSFRLKVQSTNRQDIHKFVIEKLGVKAVLTDEMPSWLVYEIEKSDLGQISRLYGIFKEARSRFGVESTMVTQMSLQDVFFKMARDAEVNVIPQTVTV